MEKFCGKLCGKSIECTVYSVQFIVKLCSSVCEGSPSVPQWEWKLLPDSCLLGTSKWSELWLSGTQKGSEIWFLVTLKLSEIWLSGTPKQSEIATLKNEIRF